MKDLKFVSTDTSISFLRPFSKYKNLYMLYLQCSVYNFQSMKTPVKLNSLLSKFLCYNTWFVILPD